MSIKLLPTQLANQIAAGEVIERPASVVKELIENSLDAGATNIIIDIEKAGSQLIKVRDNGCGIVKDDLLLAIMPHATSKIYNLADLEAILTMGFRGEALASISAISRFKLTSKTNEQQEAWALTINGRNEKPELIPASHPVGTTIEVATLFFNTPARKRFLYSDKTEFTHIDEIVKKIALAKANISFSLTHNGKKIRQYQANNTEHSNNQLKRIQAICGHTFAHNALMVDYQFADMSLVAWIYKPSNDKEINSFSYTYINGRLVRDKIINHAINQVYADLNTNNLHPQIVLFLELPPDQLDVNVHPAKAEVRFHQPRLVHDFIYQALTSVITQEPTNLNQNREAAGENIFNLAINQQDKITNKQTKSYSGGYPARKFSTAPVRQVQEPYHQLLQDLPSVELTETTTTTTEVSATHLQLLDILDQNILFKKNNQLFVISVNKLYQLCLNLQLTQQQKKLLVPVSIRLEQAQLTSKLWQNKLNILTALNFEVSVITQPTLRLKINAIPTVCAQHNLQQIILAILNNTSELNKTTAIKLITPIITAQLSLVKADIINLISQLEQQNDDWQQALTHIDLNNLQFAEN